MTVKAASKAPKGTEIAHISVADMTKKEVQEKIEKSITVWKTGKPLLIKNDFEKIEIPRTAFTFDTDQTFEELEVQTKRQLTNFFIKPKNTQLSLIVTLDEDDLAVQYLLDQTHIDTELIKQQLLETAEDLGNNQIALSYTDEDAIPFKTIAEAEMTFEDLPEHIIQKAAAELDGMIVEPETALSYLNDVDIYALLIDAKENTTAAGGLYQLFLKTNFEIAERHIMQHQSTESEPGTEAYVNKKSNEDLIVYNPNDVAFIIKAKQSADTIKLTLQSTYDESSHKYDVTTEEIDYRTLYRYSHDLSVGTENVIQQGEQGLDVKTNRLRYDQNKVFEGSDLLAHDIYLPVPRIILTSSKVEVSDDVGSEDDAHEDALDESEEDASEETIDETEDMLDYSEPQIELDEEQLEELEQLMLEEFLQPVKELKDNYTSLTEQLEEMKQSTEGDEDDESAMDKLEQENKNMKEELKTYKEELAKLIKKVEKLFKQSDDAKDKPE